MIFEKDKICNDIIKKNSSEEDVNENTKQFVKNTIEYFKRCSRDINIIYTHTLLRDSKNKIAFYCIDKEFNINNCPSAIIYQVKQNYKVKEEITYYILLIFTVTKFRNMGYASVMLNEFIQNILKKHSPTKKIKIVLSSTEKAFKFYMDSGFILTMDSLSDHRILTKYEKNDKNKEYYIFELSLNPPLEKVEPNF